MNALDQARTAYGSAAAPTKTPRATEYDALARISHRLRSAIRSKDRDYPGFVSALNDNRRLWIMFATSVADNDNGLPKDLRARLFWLAQFTDSHTHEVLTKGADAAVLIEINAAVLKGLGVEGVRPEPVT